MPAQRGRSDRAAFFCVNKPWGEVLRTPGISLGFGAPHPRAYLHKKTQRGLSDRAAQAWASVTGGSLAFVTRSVTAALFRIQLRKPLVVVANLGLHRRIHAA